MDKVIKRESRDTEVREDVAKKWQPASLLPDFTKKAGWAYRWIRVSLLNEPDNMNVSSKMREGWEPVKHSEHPEVVLQADPNSNFKEGIEIGGLLLCKAPQELMDQRAAFVKDKTKADTMTEHIINSRPVVERVNLKRTSNRGPRKDKKTTDV